MINLPPWLRKLPLLDRWLFGELTGPLLFAIAAFTVVSLSVGVMFDLVRRIVESGLPVTVAVQVMVSPGELVAVVGVDAEPVTACVGVLPAGPEACLRVAPNEEWAVRRAGGAYLNASPRAR